MAGVKISALPTIPSCALTDILPEVQPATGGTTYKASLSQIATLFNAQLSFLPLAGGTLSGALNMGGFQINALANPTLSTDAANKAYVDSVAQGLSPKAPSQAASTANLTATYANGASGVGATLTNAGAQAAFAIDGYTAAINDRILIKNQSSTFQNGIYTVTVLGSGATNWVLTRAVDMDAPSEFYLGTTLILNGTVNVNTQWTENAVVTTVGTSAVTFVQTGAAVSYPITLALGGTSANLTAMNGGIVYSNASAMAISAAGNSGQILRSGGAGTPTWSTATYPSTAGTSGNILTSDGTNFISSAPKSFTSINIQSFISSGTYTPSTGMKYCIVELVGGGGSAGSLAGSVSQAGASGGGGGGGYARSAFSAATIGASQVVTIGAGGAAPAAGNNNGNAGGTTSLGSLISATGGLGGTGNNTSAAATFNAGGAGGGSGVGTVIIVGQQGGTGWALAGAVLAFRGTGGGSQFARQTGIDAGNTGSNGMVGNSYGGGGAGAIAVSNATNLTGGAGAAGFILITEFI